MKASHRRSQGRRALILGRKFSGVATVIVIAAVGIIVSICRTGDFSDLNGSAQYLAGLRTGPTAKATAAWRNYAQKMEPKWDNFRRLQLSRVREFSQQLGIYKQKVAYYMFSGPDAAFIHAFFPDASTYVLSGLEAIGQIPDTTDEVRSLFDKYLPRFAENLDRFFRFGFFVTNEMRSSAGFPGVTPLLCIFLTRIGYYIERVDYIIVNKQGELTLGQAVSSSDVPGVKITYSDLEGMKKTLYYFQVDLTNDPLSATGFLTFCRNLGEGDSLIKNASYLMHTNEFSLIRNFILTHSATITQDDSGIPVKYLMPPMWSMRLFGVYRGPAGQFGAFYQPEVEAMQRGTDPEPVDFGIGYFWWLGGSHLQIALHMPEKK